MERAEEDREDEESMDGEVSWLPPPTFASTESRRPLLPARLRSIGSS